MIMNTRLTMLAVIIGCTSGCAPSLPASFQCSADAQCHSHGRAGVCELPQGACSFPDTTCASGKRYGTLDGPTLAGQCVPVGDGGVPNDLAGGASDLAAADLATNQTIVRVAVSTVPAANNGGDVILPRPSGVLSGDFLLVSIYLDDGAETVMPPTGWNTLSDVTSTNFHATWLDHVVSAGDPTSYDFALSGTPTMSAGALIAYRNVNSPPVDVSMTTQFEAQSFVAPSLTTTHANDMLVTLFVDASTVGSGFGWTGPSGLATAVNLTTIGVFDGLQATAGATGTKAAFFGVNVPGIGAVDFVTLTPQQ